MGPKEKAAEMSLKGCALPSSWCQFGTTYHNNVSTPHVKKNALMCRLWTSVQHSRSSEGLQPRAHTKAIPEPPGNTRHISSSNKQNRRSPHTPATAEAPKLQANPRGPVDSPQRSTPTNNRAKQHLDSMLLHQVGNPVKKH